MLRKRLDASKEAAVAAKEDALAELSEVTTASLIFESRQPLSSILPADTFALLKFHVCLVLELASRIPPSCKLLPEQLGLVVRAQESICDRILHRINGATVSPEGAARAAAVAALREATFLYETGDRAAVDGLRKEKEALLARIADFEATIAGLNKELASMQRAQISIQAASHRKLADEREKLSAAQAECQRQSVEIKRLNERTAQLREEVEQLQQERDDDRSWWQTRGGGGGAAGAMSVGDDSSMIHHPSAARHLRSITVGGGGAVGSGSSNAAGGIAGALRPHTAATAAGSSTRSRNGTALTAPSVGFSGKPALMPSRRGLAAGAESSSGHATPVPAADLSKQDSSSGGGVGARKVSIAIPHMSHTDHSATAGSRQRTANITRGAWGASDDEDDNNGEDSLPGSGAATPVNLHDRSTLMSSTIRSGGGGGGLNSTLRGGDASASKPSALALPTTSLRAGSRTTAATPQHARPNTAEPTRTTQKATGWRALVSAQRMKEAYLTLGGTEDGKMPLERDMVREFLAESFEDFGDVTRWDRVMKPYPRIAYDEFCMIVLRLVKQ